MESDKEEGSLGTTGTTQLQVLVEFGYWMQQFLKRLNRQNKLLEELVMAKEVELHGWALDLESKVFMYKEDRTESEVAAKLVEDVESLEEERAMAGKYNLDELMV